jgi:uncharacterized membrane protein (UPF0127 family)
LADKVKIAASFFERLQGLLGTSCLLPGEGLFLTPCSGIHMLFMRYAIDALFLDEQNIVVGVAEQIAPWRVSKIYKQAHSCLELPAGTIAETGTKCGDQILVTDAG